MTDAMGRHAQPSDAARLTTSGGDKRATAAALRAAVETTRSDPALRREHAAALVKLAKLEQELGRPTEAERLLRDAIAFGEQQGAPDASLGVALNELSRLYIRSSDFARAEPVLRRLLQITRLRGDRHPDVATVLAGLAVARRGLGDLAKAEQLYRHALRIREDVLAPDHMAIVITLEQLSETCAARGNVDEALDHLRRALPRREAALGAEHSTVQHMRARVADLERRSWETLAAASEAAVAPVAAAATPTVVPESPVPTPMYVESPRAPASTPAAEAPVLAEAPRMSTIELPYVEPTAAPSRRRRTTRHALAAAAVVALAITGFTVGSSGRSDAESNDGASNVDRQTADAAAPATSPAVRTARRLDSVTGLAADAPAGSVAPAAEQKTASGVAGAVPSAPVALPNLRKLVVPRIALPNVEALVPAAAKRVRDGEPELIAAASAGAAAARGDATITSPVLIGSAPVPQYPDALRAHPIEGDVIVQFRVTEKGRVDLSSLQVLQSPHELLTEAVRNILPRFRFEPARSGAPGSKPQAAWVQFRSQFTAHS